ncbi:MAG: hypothetical protein CR986_00310 [Ignavibacteriae bacterium]|nr:MAG: hypothetical protein CR986_00310 [Ignavibacteriota bacterium]
MKKNKLTIFLSLLVLFTLPTFLSAQTDTLDLGAESAANLSAVINADTVEGGVIANQNRVYRLQRGFFYILKETIKINGSFKMIATDGEGRPPILAPGINEDNSSIGRFVELFGKNANVEFHDIYFLGIKQDGEISLAANSGITVNNKMNLKIRNCIFDGYGARGIQVAKAGAWSNIDVQDSKFRNIQFPGGSWLYGQAFKTVSNTTPLDTIKFVNNSFMACGAYIFGVSGYVNHGVFDHNTIVYGIGNTFLTAYNTNIEITNNIVYSAFTNAGFKQAVYGDWFYPRPDTISSGVIVVNIPDTITYNDTTQYFGRGVSYIVDTAQTVQPSMVSDALRKFEVNHNAYYYPEELYNYIDAYNDTVTSKITVAFPYSHEVLHRFERPQFINRYTMEIIRNGKLQKVSPGVVIDTLTIWNENPDFKGADVVSHIDSVIWKLDEILHKKITADRWTYKMTYPPAWPLPEDLAYTNSTLLTASTKGFPLGDLNWFPEKKQEWLTGLEKIDNVIPNKIELSQNYPNPFNPVTKINFKLTKSSKVTLKVFNILGQEVATLVNKQLNSGTYNVDFNASKLASGMYIYQLNAGDVSISKKMTLLK